MKLKLPLFVLQFFILCNITQAQFSESYFNDEQKNKGGEEVKCYLKQSSSIIVGGYAFDQFTYQASIYKIDTFGNVLWKLGTDIKDGSYYASAAIYINYSGVYKLSFTADSNILAAFQIPGNSGHNEIWKINSISGNIIWKKKFPAGTINSIVHYKDSASVISFHPYPILSVSLTEINENNGETLDTSGNILNSTSTYSMQIVKDKNNFIYGIYGGNHLIKFDSSETHTILFDSTYKPSSGIFTFDNLYFEDSCIYIFGETALACKINPSNGHLLWYSNAPAMQSAEFTDMKMDDKYIYASYQHTGTGGIQERYITAKFNRSNGTVIWGNSYLFTGIRSGGNPMGGGPLSLDIDNNKDVYLTGYYGADGPDGYWGILKLNGNTGKSIYEQTVFEDSTPTIYSGGRIATIINNRPFFVGKLGCIDPYTFQNAHLQLIKLEAKTGKVLLQKNIGGFYQYGSSTKSIKKYGKNKIMVLKEVGASLQVEMYDNNKSLLWKREITRNGILLGQNLIELQDKRILFTAVLFDNDYTFPLFRMNIIINLIFILDSTGTIVKEIEGGNIGIPFQVVDDKIGNKFVFTSPSGNMYVYKIDSKDSISSIYLSEQHYDIPIQSTTAIDNDSALMYFGSSSNNTRPYVLNKTTLKSTSLFCHLNLKKVNYIRTGKLNRIFICGVNTAGESFLACLTQRPGWLDTVWTRSYSYNEEFYKFVFSKDSNFIYVIGKYSYKTPYVFIRKFSLKDGTTEWSYNLPDSNKLGMEPIDFTFDAYASRIAMTGYRGEIAFSDTVKNIFITILDTSGNAINTYFQAGDFNGDNSGVCIEFINHDDMWVGGYIKHNPYGNAGFLFDSDTSYTFPTYPNCRAYFYLQADSSQKGLYYGYNLSTGRTNLSYLWSFGDGATSTDKYPEHTYADSGFYNICLTITGDSACNSSYCDSSFYIARTDGAGIHKIIIRDITTSVILPHSGENLLEINPNPCLNCEIKGKHNVKDLIVTDELGRRVSVTYSATTFGYSLNFKEDIEGLYFIKDLHTGAVAKFIKSR